MDKDRLATGACSWLDMHHFIGDLMAASASGSAHPLREQHSEETSSSAWPKVSQPPQSTPSRESQGKSAVRINLRSEERESRDHESYGRSYSQTKKSRSFKMKAYILIAVLAFTFLQRSTAFLEVKGPSEPILEGQDVTLECVDTESELNISTVHFQRYSKYTKTWYRLEADQEYFYRRCFLYDVDVRREEGKLLLSIASIQSYSEGPYRCISEDSSAPDNSSQPFTIPIHYMREVAVHRSGLGSLTRYFNSVQDLKVRLGDDVELECSTSASEAPEYFWAKEGEDWILPSNKLKLEKVRNENEGRYTCSAQSPTVRSLVKKRTISITVLAEDAAWYETTTGRIGLTAFAALLVLLVIVISMTTFLCRRANQRKCKGPIDDRSQKKPIYRSSVESLPSTAGDKQPLV